MLTVNPHNNSQQNMAVGKLVYTCPNCPFFMERKRPPCDFPRALSDTRQMKSGTTRVNWSLANQIARTGLTRITHWNESEPSKAQKSKGLVASLRASSSRSCQSWPSPLSSCSRPAEIDSPTSLHRSALASCRFSPTSPLSGCATAPLTIPGPPRNPRWSPAEGPDESHHTCACM